MHIIKGMIVRVISGNHKGQSGKVLDVFPNKKFLVRCSGGVLLIHSYDGVTPSVGSCFDVTNSPFENFKRNVYGFFDCT